jgi:hypothetical protein
MLSLDRDLLSRAAPWGASIPQQKSINSFATGSSFLLRLEPATKPTMNKVFCAGLKSIVAATADKDL